MKLHHIGYVVDAIEPSIKALQTLDNKLVTTPPHKGRNTAL